ncbi:MAG: hypothetical protein ACO3A2_06555 [Bdellovibrionia bacterium]
MSSFSPFGIPGFDPSKMDPKVLMELSQLIQSLPPDQLSRMQSLMHNTMAGLDVRKDLEEFERNLPPGFKEKITRIMLSQGSPTQPTIPIETQTASSEIQTHTEPMDLRAARLTILTAVAEGKIAPEEAERLLFQSDRSDL